MGWFSRFLTSSIGQKIIMSLTGLFLITFLIVHLVGNLQLLKDDGGEAFNVYAYFMTHNPLIKTVSYGLYFFILLHTVQGLALARKNRAARGGQGYAVKASSQTSWASRNMALLGALIFVFIVIHMGDFWFQMKFGPIGTQQYAGMDMPVKDLYTKVAATFGQPLFVFFYVFSMAVLGFHLAHGFQSAFQSLGLNHPKYSPFIKTLGLGLSLVLSLGFAVIPIAFYFMK